jgi:hypothetical protein
MHLPCIRSQISTQKLCTITGSKSLYRKCMRCINTLRQELRESRVIQAAETRDRRLHVWCDVLRVLKKVQKFIRGRYCVLRVDVPSIIQLCLAHLDCFFFLLESKKTTYLQHASTSILDGWQRHQFLELVKHDHDLFARAGLCVNVGLFDRWTACRQLVTHVLLLHRADAPFRQDCTRQYVQFTLAQCSVLPRDNMVLACAWRETGQCRLREHARASPLSAAAKRARSLS